MARIPINYGTTAGDGTGDIIFTSFESIESNFVEVYGFNTAFQSTAIGQGSDLIGFGDPDTIYTATTVEAALTEVMNEKDQLIADLAGTTIDDTSLGGHLIGYDDPQSITAATNVADALSDLVAGGTSRIQVVLFNETGAHQVTSANVEMVSTVPGLVMSAAPLFLFDDIDLVNGLQTGMQLHVKCGLYPVTIQSEDVLTDSGFIIPGHKYFQFGSHRQYTLYYVSSDTWYVSNEHIREMEGLVNEAIPLAVTSLPYLAMVSSTIALPLNVGCVRMHASTNCYVAFGDETVTVSASTGMFMTKGTELLGLPIGATHIAVAGETQGGMANLTGLSIDLKPYMTTTVVGAVGPTSKSVALPAGTRVRITAMEDCYVLFGDSTIEVTNETGMYFEAGTEIVSKLDPTTHIGYTHMAFIRHQNNGAIHVTGIA
jgi:hypothetical protein